MAVPPRIRFLQRAQKQQGQQIPKPENFGKDSDFGVIPSSDSLNPQKFRNTSSSGSSDEESDRKQDTRLTQQSLAFGNGENGFALPIISQILRHTLIKNAERSSSLCNPNNCLKAQSSDSLDYYIIRNFIIDIVQWIVKSGGLKWAYYVACMGKTRNVYIIFEEKPHLEQKMGYVAFTFPSLLVYFCLKPVISPQENIL